MSKKGHKKTHLEWERMNAAQKNRRFTGGLGNILLIIYYHIFLPLAYQFCTCFVSIEPKAGAVDPVNRLRGKIIANIHK